MTLRRLPMCSGAFGLLLVCSTITRLPAAPSVWPYFGPSRATARIARRKTSGRLRRRFRYGPVPATARSSRVDDGFASRSACVAERRRRSWLSHCSSTHVQRQTHLHFGCQSHGELAGRNLAARAHGCPQRREVGLRSAAVRTRAREHPKTQPPRAAQPAGNDDSADGSRGDTQSARAAGVWRRTRSRGSRWP